MNDAANEHAANYRVNSNNATSGSFECKEKITGKTQAIGGSILDTKVVAPLKYLSNFWRYLDLRLIVFEIELDLSWSKDC